MKSHSETILSIKKILKEKTSEEIMYLKIRSLFRITTANRKCTPKYTIEEIEEQIFIHTGKTAAQMRKDSQIRENVLPRQMAYYKAYNLTSYSLYTIGAVFGGKDHATVLHGARTIQNLLDTDRGFREEHQLFLTT